MWTDRQQHKYTEEKKCEEPYKKKVVVLGHGFADDVEEYHERQTGFFKLPYLHLRHE